MKRDRDMVSLCAGVAALALGGLEILDQSGAIDLSFGWFGAALAAAIGAVLVISGLNE